MDLGGAPEWVLKAHSSDQVAHLFGDPRSAPGRTRPPSPVSGETHSMPPQDSLGPDNGYGVKDARAATIAPNEPGASGPTQMRSTSRTLPKNVELMPQPHHLPSHLPSRLRTLPHLPP